MATMCQRMLLIPSARGHLPLHLIEQPTIPTRLSFNHIKMTAVKRMVTMPEKAWDNELLLQAKLLTWR